MSAILIDLENTLLDRSASVGSFAKRLLSDFGNHLDHHSTEDIELVVTRSEKDDYRSLDARFTTAKEAIGNGLATQLRWSKPIPVTQLENYWAEHFPQHALPMPGAEAFLSTLQKNKHTVAILSNGCHASRQTMMGTLGFTSLVQEIFSSESLGAAKPDSAAFKTAIKQLGSSCEKSFHIGDHPFHDILGAQRVGITAIWLQGCHPWPNFIPTPTFKVTHLLDALKIIKNRKRKKMLSRDEASFMARHAEHQFA